MPKLYTFKDPNFNPLQNYIIDKTLGQGTFGKVKLGIHKCTNEKVAIKILEKQKIENDADYVRIQREIHILRKIRHPNIIQLYEIIESEIKLYLITEFAPGGELFEHIVSKSKLEEREAGRLFFQLLNAIEYIHQLGIVHRDLKPENILLDANKQVKVVDFGLSNMYQPNQKLHTPCGSPCYAAPEMVSGLPYEGLKTDLWSCGIILYAMICGCVPFEDPNTKQLYEKIKHSDFKLPKQVSPQAADLLKKILQKDPAKRITINEIRQHDFILFAGKMTIPNGVNTKLENFHIDVDQQILEQLLQFYVSQPEAIQMIQNNKHNCITTCYYLLKQQRERESENKPKELQSTEKTEKKSLFTKATQQLEQQKSSPIVKQKLYSQQQPSQQNQALNQDVQQQILLHLLQHQQQLLQIQQNQQAKDKQIKLEKQEKEKQEKQEKQQTNQQQVSKVAETGGSSSMEMFVKAFSDRNQSKSQNKGKTKSQDPVPHRDISVPKKVQMPTKNQKQKSSKPTSQSKDQLAQLLATKHTKYLGNTDSTTYVRHKSNLKFKQGSTERSDRQSSNSQRSELTYLKRSVENRCSQHIKNDRQTRMMSTYAFNDTNKPILTQPNERVNTDLSKEDQLIWIIQLWEFKFINTMFKTDFLLNNNKKGSLNNDYSTIIMLKYYKSTLSFCTTHYQKLGVSPNDTIDIIKAAYIKLAKLHHPDVNSEGNETKFKEITNAYNILKDPIKKQLYDQSINQTTTNQYSNQMRDSPHNNGWQYNGEQQRQWQDYNKKQSYKAKKQSRGTNSIYIVLAFGGIFLVILSVVPEYHNSERRFQQKHISKQSQINENPTSYAELKQLYDQLEEGNQQQRYLTHIAEENQSQLRRQNVIYQSQNINDSPFIVNQRRKIMKEEMKQKQFKIEVETYDKVIKGNSKILKRKQKNNPQKGELKTKHGDLTLEGYANQQKLEIQKSIDQQSVQPTQLSIEHLEQGYM